MALRVVIVGPGRVGQALGERLYRSGVDLLGFIGRDPVRTRAAIAWLGDGRVPVLSVDAHRQAHVVLFAVGDAELPAAVASLAAAAAPRPCSLWLHTSGRHGLDVFDGVARVRTGILHPVAPFAEARRASAAMVGAPAVLVGDARAQRLLRVLCGKLGLLPVHGEGGDRTLYHAACALAANGATALWAAAETALAASGVVGPGAARMLVQALVTAAASGCGEQGPIAALSGPVRRGDGATVQAHLQALAAHDPTCRDAYRALAQLAARLAAAAGLPAELQAAVQQALAEPGQHRGAPTP